MSTSRKTKTAVHSILSHWPGYILAVAAVVVASLIRWVLLRYIGGVSLFLTFYPAVFAAAVVGGTGPGMLATLLSAFVADFFFIEPAGTLVLPTPVDMMNMLIFGLVNIGISILSGRLRAKSTALQASETRMRLAYQSAKVGSFEWNVESGVDNWSAELEAMYGLKPGEFGSTKEAWETLVYPEDRPKAVAAVERALKTFQPEEGEWRVVWPDESVHWLVGRYQAFPNHAGKPVRLVGINIDITARKKAEEALREREEWFRTMAEAIPQLAWMARPDGYVFWFNHSWFEYTGTSLEQMQGSGWQSVHDAEELPRVLERWRQCTASGESCRLEFALRGADGRFRSFLTYAVPLKDKDGRVALWFCTHTDISHLREQERALRRQARLIDLAPAATLVRRVDGTIMFWSEGAERLYGWTKAEALGRRTNELLRTEFSEPLESIVATLHKGGIWSGELVHHTRDQRRVVVESYWLAELNDQDEVEEILESNTDVTERKRLQTHLEEEVEARTAELRTAMAELEHMSYSMIHDMRAPLRAMQTFANILKEESLPCGQSPGSDYLRRISESAYRLDRLITDALNYNRVIREDLTMIPVEIGCLLRGMIHSYPNLQPHFADINIDFEKLVVRGNESLLTQCFGNLLGNAVKFVAAGVRPSIRIWAEETEGRDAETIKIWISDNGIGIPGDAQEKIFQMFHRMHHAFEYPGTGIGLTIVKKAVERMNGRVGLESEPGHGSKFWIELPKAVPTPSGAYLHEAG